MKLFGLEFEPPPPPAYASREIELPEPPKAPRNLYELQRLAYLERFRREFLASI
jgi:hypothetical protein